MTVRGVVRKRPILSIVVSIVVVGVVGLVIGVAIGGSDTSKESTGDAPSEAADVSGLEDQVAALEAEVAEADDAKKKLKQRGQAVKSPSLGAIDSGIKSVPIPESAEPNPNLEDAWTVEGVSYDELVAWYEEQMPEGEGTSAGGTGATPAVRKRFHAHIYARGARAILSGSITDTDPPGILIRRRQVD